MGEVWAGLDRRLDRRVAVKVLHAPLGLDGDQRARFAAEARAAARLNHPNVVTVYDSGEHEGCPYLVMELLPGRTLADELAAGPLEEGRARSVGLDLLAALDASHRAGILHRDVKPANVLLTEDGTARLADFGIAKGLEGSDLTATGIVLGTTSYLAPERLTGHAASERSDLYGVGAVLYEALAGRRPYEADSLLGLIRAFEGPPPPSLRACRPELGADLVAAVGRALQVDPAARFASAAEMAHALDATLPAVTAGPSPAPPTRPLVLTRSGSRDTVVETGSPGAPPPRLDRAEAPPVASPQPTPSSTAVRWPARRVRVVAAAAVGVLLGLLAAGRLWPSSGGDPEPPATAATSSLPEPLDDAFRQLEGTLR